MRRRDPTDLTDRERDVLELLRRDFTNEQIAERFGISLDGAGILVTQDVDQFRSQAGSVQAEALIVDKEYAGQLESAWLQQNLDGGKVLVGARINISELGQLLGVSGCESSPGFGNYPES